MGPQRIGGGEVARSDGGERDRAVACRFIEPHCQSTPGGPYQVDLHNHGGGPAETLVDAQQHVREDHPTPGRSEDDEERNRQPNEPAHHQHPLAPDAITESARKEVGQRFHHTETHDEGENSRGGSQAEDPLPEKWHNAALQSHHATNEGIDDYQQRKLLPVGAQAKLNIRLCWLWEICLYVRRWHSGSLLLLDS